MALLTGDLLQGRYRIGAPLGSGGMATVFSATDEPGGAELVVKQLRLDAPELLESFRGEFAVLSRVSGPHLVRVMDFGSERVRGELLHYYVAERVAGVTLRERASRGGSVTDLLRPVLDALRGLAVLHDAGIRHGDFTPSNVLVSQSGGGVLIDLGCARPFGPTELLGGTEGFVAPELLSGQPGDGRSDLYGVGRTLSQLFELSRQVPPAHVARVIERLLRPAPTGRPTDCAEVLQALGQKPSLRQKLCVPPRILGRELEIASFEAWLSQVTSGVAVPRVLALTGAAGMGTSRLLRELTWRAELRLAVRRAGPSRSFGLLLASSLGLAGAVNSLRGVLAAVNALASSGEPLLLVVEDYDRLEREQAELVLALARSLPSGGSLALLVSGRVAPAGVSAQELVCGPLARAAVEEWASGSVPTRKLDELYRRSGGSPRRLELGLRELHLGGTEVAVPSAPDEGMARARARMTKLEPSARAAVALVFVLGGELSATTVQLAWSELDNILGWPLVEREGAWLRLAQAGKAAIEAGALTAGELGQAHLRAAEAFARSETEGPPSAPKTARRIYHLTLAGELAQAEQLFSEGLELLGSAPPSSAEQLLPLLARTEQLGLMLAGAELLLKLGRPRAAIRVAARAARLNGTPEVRRQAALSVSDALVRLGRPARAELLLGGLLAQTAPGDEVTPDPAGTAEILMRLGRARLSRGDYAGAKRTAEQALQHTCAPGLAGLAHETLGVACSYLGELEQAGRELDSALSLLGESQQPRDRSRIQSHRAMVAFRAGRVESALTDYAGALALAEEHELTDLTAAGLLNLGTAEQQSGLWGSALRHYERGVLFARAIGRVSTELTLEYNLANLYAEVGAFERAQDSLSRLELAARAARFAHFSSGIALIRGEVQLARGEPALAEAELLAAERELIGRAQPRELFEVRLRRVDVELLLGKPQEAERKLKALARSQSLEVVGELALNLELSWARVELALGRPSALERLLGARGRAQQAGLLALEASIETELSSATERFGSLEEARVRAERARRLWDRVGAELPAPLAGLFWRHPRRARLVESSRVFTAPTEGVPGRGSSQALGEAEAYRRLLSLNRRLNSSLSLERVLEYAVQAAVDLTEAERGFLVLASGATLAEQTEVTVACSTEAIILGEQAGPSQSIVRQTFEREEPILTTDAQGDPRFAGQGSVHAMRLKSVLSVPILSPSGMLGVLYVDCRVQRGRFSEAERELLLAFADQLAIAISNARLHRELEQKTAELAQQKHSVEQLARGQSREIERLKREVQTQRQNLSLRYDYSQIVGRGPAMRAVLERLDRVIDSEVTVLVLGESGTGKELVARAIHWNGPRKAGPFLGINCAALPEALLESELFGHVRGAFTGADRDKQGLLQAAAGGTLFLDEIAELPLATQAKLLRVLQEREVRPLGAVKSSPLDVRIVAATHRDLSVAMEQAKFREDLYYRIAVVSVRLPPLRERIEDLPTLCEKILAGLALEAGRKPLELGQDALRRLAAHPFRGNVRELQNILTRAFVLCSGARLRAEDLDLGDGLRPAPRAASRRDFEADERTRILTALRGTRWNVSVVSRTLGIPRNTLYRKLERYGIARTREVPE